MSRKEKRKELKKVKRKQLRREAALLWSVQEEGEREEEGEEAVIRQQREEGEALAKERAEHDDQERLWLLREEEAQKEWLRRQEEEAERKRKEEERSRKGEDGEEDLEEGWEYVEDGPAEIIWKGNEIIVKKPRKKVRKGTGSGVLAVEDKNGPTGEYSNPLPPQSTAFSSYQANIQDVADQSTNFGTEQDKTNCPFYIKQGVCRFGVRCSRLHPVFNDACTLLMRSMYSGAGLALEPVESLEYTDEEVVQEYEEFYDDVHSEFLQFGEIVNFKVCRNSSPHLRGNVYVHYASRESAVAAYNHMNGRFYAKKQISCEFVGVTKWKLAICGEFMRTCYKTCSRGTACNFLHCFENPRREYEWADVDRPPPRFWQRKMANLFGYAPKFGEDFDERQERSRTHRESTQDNERGRRRNERELTYDDDRRKDRHSRETVREDDQRRGRDDRERTFYEDEVKDRIRRGSKYDDRQRVRHLRESSYGSRRRNSTYDEDDNHSHSRRRDSTYDDDLARDKSTSRSRYGDDLARDKSTSRSRYGDDQGSINDERWSPGDDHGRTDDKKLVHYRDRRRDRRRRESSYEEDDEDNDDGHHSHSRSHRHRSRRRSRSPGSHKTPRSRSQDSHRARSHDGYYSSSEEQEDRSSKVTREGEGKKERASRESKRHRHDSPVGSHPLEREEDDVQRHRKRRHSSRERWSYSESEDEPRVKVLESDVTTSRHSKDLEPTVAGLVSDENAGGSLRKLESDSGTKAGVEVENLNQEANSNSNSTVTGVSLELSTDDVQKSTSQWQSWRKTKSKKAKLGLKEAPMRIII